MSGGFVFDPPGDLQCVRDLMDRGGRQVTCIRQTTSTLPQDDEGGGQMSVD